MFSISRINLWKEKEIERLPNSFINRQSSAGNFHDWQILAVFHSLCPHHSASFYRCFSLINRVTVALILVSCYGCLVSLFGLSNSRLPWTCDWTLEPSSFNVLGFLWLLSQSIKDAENERDSRVNGRGIVKKRVPEEVVVKPNELETKEMWPRSDL